MWPKGLDWGICECCKICLGGCPWKERAGWFGISELNPATGIGWAPKVETILEGFIVCDGEWRGLGGPEKFGGPRLLEANTGLFDGTIENHGLVDWKWSPGNWAAPATGYTTACLSVTTEASWEGIPSWLWAREYKRGRPSYRVSTRLPVSILFFGASPKGSSLSLSFFPPLFCSFLSLFLLFI